jgi:hypothetical protein
MPATEFQVLFDVPDELTLTTGEGQDEETNLAGPHQTCQSYLEME